MTKHKNKLSPPARARKVLRMAGWARMYGENSALWEIGGGAAPYCVAVILPAGDIIQATYDNNHEIISTDYTSQAIIKLLLPSD